MSFYLPILTPYYKCIEITEKITDLWSGCGEIARGSLDGTPCVIKAINVPKHIDHPRITQTEFALNRKRHSYQVEFFWYQHYATQLPFEAQSISCFNTIEHAENKVLVFADFNVQGFSRAALKNKHITCILKWLAYFHAFHFQVEQTGLWHQGNYWHLATRPDEYNKMPKSAIKSHANEIADLLSTCPFLTLIHGDAKLANFAVNDKTAQVYGYDFQYTGGGVGVIDVMYFLGSCLNQQQLQDLADDYLNTYFRYFTDAMQKFDKSDITDTVIDAWRALWPVAWADFHRFLIGWSPNHSKINPYMLMQSKKVINNIKEVR